MFSDLLGSQTVKEAETKFNEVEDKPKGRNPKDLDVDGQEHKFTLYDLFGSNEPRARSEPDTSPSREALGFGSKPMSFMTNFKFDLPFNGRKVSKRSADADASAEASAEAARLPLRFPD